MSITGIKEGDIVRCDVRGRRFYAVVEEKIPRALRVKPITPNITYHCVKSTEVIEHFRRAKNGK